MVSGFNHISIDLSNYPKNVENVLEGYLKSSFIDAIVNNKIVYVDVRNIASSIFSEFIGFLEIAKSASGSFLFKTIDVGISVLTVVVNVQIDGTVILLWNEEGP